MVQLQHGGLDQLIDRFHIKLNALLGEEVHNIRLFRRAVRRGVQLFRRLYADLNVSAERLQLVRVDLGFARSLPR